MFEVLGDEQKGLTIIHCDNMSTIKLSRNPVMHERSKLIDVRFHVLRDLCKDGKIELQYCKSGEHIVDIMAKPLKQLVLEKLRNMLGVCSFRSINQGETADEEDYMVVNKSKIVFSRISLRGDVKSDRTRPGFPLRIRDKPCFPSAN
ncbi:hypothetical protein CerSpe_069440 [Prunus speciosa]